MSTQELAGRLLDPLPLLFLAVVALTVVRGRIRGFALVVVAVFYLASVPLTAKVLGGLWAVNDSYDPTRTYDSVVPLAGVIDEGRYVSADFARFRGIPALLFNDNVARLLSALSLALDGHARRLLYGQARAGAADETSVVRRFALAQGLAADRFIVYGKVARTLDEAAGMRAWVERSGSTGRVLVVTSWRHMRRALAAFRRQGLAPDTYSIGRRSGTLVPADFVPSVSGLQGLHHLLYEYGAYLVYWWRGAV